MYELKITVKVDDSAGREVAKKITKQILSGIASLPDFAKLTVHDWELSDWTKERSVSGFSGGLIASSTVFPEGLDT